MPIFLVAEVGTAWQGDLEKAKTLISKAKQAGADAVKFQLFKEEQLEKLNVKLQEKLESMILSEKQFLNLKEHGDRERIDVFASAMYPEAVDILVNADCKFIKIREKDSENINLIQKALDTGKFVFVSTTKLPLKPYLLFNPRIRWMYVVPYYPPREDELHLSQVIAYHGISDHYPSISSALAAVSIILHQYGVNYEFIVEKHVVPEHNPEYVDDAVSITFEEFSELARYTRELEKMTWEATDKKMPVI